MPVHHTRQPLINHAISLQKAGERGEREVFTFLQEAYHDKPVTILYNFHSKKSHSFAIQIDYIVFTKSYILLLEVKNIKGTISFRQNPAQLFRVLEHQEQVMDCPFSQMDRNLLHFKKLLGKTPLPVFTAIVWANRSAIIEPLTFESIHPLLFLKQLPHYLSRFESLPNQKVDLKRLIQKIQSLATPYYKSALCERYGIDSGDLAVGMQCLTCSYMMDLHKKTWNCANCRVKQNHMIDENILMLYDFLGERLSMKRMNELLPSLEYRMLKRLIDSGNLTCHGGRRGRVYQVERPEKVKWVEVEDMRN